MTMDPSLFGTKLIVSGDLDPVYFLILDEVKRNPDRASAWLLAYACFYNVQTVLFIMENYDIGAFWPAMMIATGDSKYKRSTERRHWRGKAAMDAFEALRKAFPDPAKFVRYLTYTPTIEAVLRQARQLPQFGPWIAFKLADILERCFSVPLAFPRDMTYFYGEPGEGAELAATYWGLKAPIHAVLRMIGELSIYDAPPRFERAVNVQEVETVLCKWKSYTNGHYYLGKDINELKLDLAYQHPVAEHYLRLIDAHTSSV